MYQKGFKYRIYPNNMQKELIEKHFGCTRFLYNYGLDKKIKEYEKTKKAPSCFDLIKEIPSLKEKYPWLKEVNSQSLQMAFRNLDDAFTNFFRTKKGFPNFKSKKNPVKSYQVPQSWRIDDKLRIPKMMKEGIRIKYHRELEGKAKTLTVSKTSTNKYFVSIICEVPSKNFRKLKITEENTIGIDLGLTHFATLSNGEKIDNPRFLKTTLKKLAKEQRKLSKKQKGSNNKNKQRLKVAKVYEKITNQRNDFLHQLSSKLIRENQSICIEDLNVKGMIKNKYLSQSISDVSWSEFRRQLEYKSNWYSRNLIIIGRFEPSSKLCNVCGTINNDLKLSDREWTCKICNTKHDRDILAANNIKIFGINKSLRQELSDFKPVEMLSLESSKKQEAKEL